MYGQRVADIASAITMTLIQQSGLAPKQTVNTVFTHSTAVLRRNEPSTTAARDNRAMRMTEPASTAFGGIALYKLGVLGAFAAVLVTIVVMAMTLPKTVREFVVAMICTVVSSIGGGAFVIRWFELQHFANDDIGVIALAGIIFVCGLPAWVMVRAWFVYAELRKNMSLIDMLHELKAVVWSKS